MQIFRKLGLALVLGWAMAASAGEPSQENGSPLVLQNATIHTLSGSEPFVGSIVVEDGKIAAVGESVDHPTDATVLDLAGFHVYPGLIESRGKLWLTPGAIGENNAKAELNVVDGLDPWSEDWRELAAQGITSVFVQPSSASRLGGYGALLRVGPHGDSEGIVIRKEVAIQASVGITGNTSRDRHAQIEALRKQLESAREKKKEDESKKDSDGDNADDKEESGEESEKDDESGEGDGDGEDQEGDSEEDEQSKDGKADEEEKLDPTKKALRRVLNREIPLHVEVHHSDALVKVLKLAEELEIRVVLDGLSHVESRADEILKSGLPVVVGPLLETGNPPNYRNNADFGWLSHASRADALWAIGTFSNQPRASQLLRLQAAAAISQGADPSSTLEAITLNPARLLGAEELLGTIEVGKSADLSVFGGSPLDPSVPTRLTLSQGVVTYDNPNAAAGGALALADAPELPERMPTTYVLGSERILMDGQFQSGKIVVRDGKIDAIGDDVEVGDLPFWDLGATVITPGLVNAHSNLDQAAALGDPTESDTSHLRAVDAVDPVQVRGNEMLAAGFVHVGIAPGLTNTSSGVMGHLRLGASQFVAQPAIASQFVLAGSARQEERYPASLNGQRALLDQLLSGKPASSRLYVTSPVSQSLSDARRINLAAARDGSRKSVLVADTRLEILAALDLIGKYELTAVIRSAGDVGELVDQLASAKVGLIAGLVDGTEYHPQLEQYAKVAAAGVPIAFGGDTGEQIRATAAVLVQAGLDRSVALRGLTGGGAALVGMESTDLAAGNPADLVIWTGSPLNLGSRPLAVIVDGQPVSTK